MLKSERRDQKRDRKLAKARRASNRKALFVLQQATAQRLGLRLGAMGYSNRHSRASGNPGRYCVRQAGLWQGTSGFPLTRE